MALKRRKGTNAHKKSEIASEVKPESKYSFHTPFSLMANVIIQTCSRVMFLAADFVLLSDTSPSSWPWSLTLSLLYFCLNLRWNRVIWFMHWASYMWNNNTPSLYSMWPNQRKHERMRKEGSQSNCWKEVKRSESERVNQFFLLLSPGGHFNCKHPDEGILFNPISLASPSNLVDYILVIAGCPKVDISDFYTIWYEMMWGPIQSAQNIITGRWTCALIFNSVAWHFLTESCLLRI